ncbi:MAG: co-chaperone GroES [Clostridia bacterium]|nr:co-chaperone GroES [Clostridia bacterium]
MLRPLQDKVVLAIKKEEEVIKGGIILSSHSNVKSQMATVVAVGFGEMVNGVRTIMEVREKDTVFIEKGVGIEIEYEGEQYIVVSQKDILAVIK